jgi:hypothetical protein
MDSKKKIKTYQYTSKKTGEIKEYKYDVAPYIETYRKKKGIKVIGRKRARGKVCEYMKKMTEEQRQQILSFIESDIFPKA